MATVAITDYRNAKWLNQEHTIASLEVLTNNYGWIETSIDMNQETLEPHLQPIKEWLTNNPLEITAYTPDLDKEKQLLLNEIADRRYREECGGMLINGMPLKTDRDAQAKYTGAGVQAFIDNTIIFNWKTANGTPIQIDATTMLGIVQSVRGHVQACYDREFALAAAVEDGTYTPNMIDEGWPTYTN